MENLEKNLAFVLAKHGIITREDLAEQSVDDLLLIPGIDAQQAADLIMTARKIWFDS
jgi:N utilization substance protein A